MTDYLKAIILLIVWRVYEYGKGGCHGREGVFSL